jgi:choloylglycine hydrolase
MCTGISLMSEDGGVIVARTVEWALGDAKHNQIVIFPRGKVFRAQTPDGLNGMSWKGRFGLVSVAAYDQPYGPDAMIDGKTILPFGGGSGLVGLPGDFTPPSRFVRAAVLTATARPLPTVVEAVFEAFRILDGFNIPVGLTAARGNTAQDITSATQITTASDLKNRRYYFHTMNSREVRMIDLSKIDFSTVKEQMIDGDEGRKNAVREISISAPNPGR